MQYTMKRREDQEALLKGLLAMPDVLDASFRDLSIDDASRPGPDGSSPVEICWHLADLEAEGYSVRIRRLLVEDHPKLPDFNGEAIAKARDYRRLSLSDALALFRAARRANVTMFRNLTESQWTRSGVQEGVGTVSVCDVPTMMAEHDAGHHSEVKAWIASRSES